MKRIRCHRDPDGASSRTLAWEPDLIYRTTDEDQGRGWMNKPRRKRPLRALLRALDRALLGPVMSAGAFIIERRVVRAIKSKPTAARATGDGADRSQEQG